ncbi:hypothetical protein ANN_04265 [Periplaneta americana]|uniref:DUF659 domain-containing protein n=1 Tax=Periplaneta americana TaxID=6978 RepID=A0ABQ8T834_PERAM|nr:hypothetical protein ANN_04265 [Periplaneta americana]
MWIWRRRERVNWADRIRNEAVLKRVGEERMMLKLIRKRKRNWLDYWLRRNCILKDALEGMNKVLRKIFGAKRDEVTGEWRKLHNAELHALYSSPDIIRNIKSRRLRWAGHVARMGESRNAYRMLVGRPEGKRPLGRPRRRWEDNIKMDLREVGYDDRHWINLAQDRDRWRAYVRAAMNLRNFIEKYTEKQLPSESTLRKNYLPDCYADVLNQIRKAVGNNKIWVSVDETTDETGRFVAHVVVGTLSPDGPGEKFLLTAEVLDKVNHASIVTLFENSMSLLWPDGVKRENILLLVTDSAAYMMKAGRQIKLSYPNICHMTCLAHCLHLSHDLSCSLSSQSSRDCEELLSRSPEIPLPPKPIITRWGTWLDAASYYAKYYEKIVDVLAVLNSEDCSSVAIAKDLVSEQLRDHIMYIEQKFKDLSKCIKLLETSAMEISKSLKVVQDLSTALDQVREGPAQAVTQKLKTIIDKNVGYSDLCQIRDQLASTENQTHNSDSEYIQYFKFAPVTSCDIGPSPRACAPLPQRAEQCRTELARAVTLHHRTARGGLLVERFSAVNLFVSKHEPKLPLLSVTYELSWR